jgi:hypothetical protein
VAIATLVVAAAGIAMSMLLGWGFFSVFWLGVKQGIMAAIIIGMIVLTPLFVRTYAAIARISGPQSLELQTARTLIGRVERFVILMRLGGVAAILLAVWRPTG